MLYPKGHKSYLVLNSQDSFSQFFCWFHSSFRNALKKDYIEGGVLKDSSKINDEKRAQDQYFILLLILITFLLLLTIIFVIIVVVS